MITKSHNSKINKSVKTCMNQHHYSRLLSLGALVGALMIAGAAQAQTNVYPIAVSAAALAGANPGDVVLDIFNGAGHGNFGWVTWTGNTTEAALITSLSGVGNASTYINPDTAHNEQLAVGDWVMGKLGVSNSIGVRNALDDLEDNEIILPVWDMVRGSGTTLAYHISGFVKLQIKGYRLPGQGKITVVFGGVFDNPSGDDGGGDGGPNV
jgi:hypothetical protein